MKKIVLIAMAVVSCAAFADEVGDITLTAGASTNLTGEVSFGKLTFSGGGGSAFFNGADVLAGWIDFETSGTAYLEFRDTTADFGSAVGTSKETSWFICCGTGTEKMDVVIDDSVINLRKGLVVGATGTGSYCNFHVTNSTIALTQDAAVLNTTGAVCMEFVGSELTTAFSRNSTSTGLKLGVAGGDAGGGSVPGSARFENSSAGVDSVTWVGMYSPFSLAVTGAESRFRSYRMMVGGWNYSQSLPGVRKGNVAVYDGAVLEVYDMNVGTQFGGEGTLAVTNAVLEVHKLYGGYGTGRLSFDGATILMAADGGELFSGIDTLEIGAGGLTVDTAGYAVTVMRSFSGGPVVFTGGGTVTVASGVTIANFIATKGTSVVWVDTGTTETFTQDDQSAGIVTRTDDIVRNGNDTLVFDVAAGSGLKLEGKTVAGSFVKNGGGLLSLDNPEDVFYGNVALNGGTLQFGPEGPAGVNGLFFVTGESGSEPVVVKTDRDVTLTLYHHADYFTRPFIKRGVGELRFSLKPFDWKPFDIPAGPVTAFTGYRDCPQIDFGDGTAVPSTSCSSMNVAEGRLVVDCSGSDPWQLGTFWTVGNPVVSCAAQPELVFDGGDRKRMIRLLQKVALAPGAGSGTSVLTSPKVFFRNIISTYGVEFHVAPYSDDPDLRPYVCFSNSSIRCSSYTVCGGYQQAYGTRPFAVHRFEAGSKLAVNPTGHVYMRGPSRIEFDRSELARGFISEAGEIENKACASIYYYDGATSNTFVFANGATFYSDGGAVMEHAGMSIGSRQEFVFDDGLVDPLTTAAEFTYEFTNSVPGAYFEVRGTGLVMAPAAGQTFTLAEPLHGEGGFVNRGEGTVVLADGAVRYSGVTRAQSGTVSFADADVANVTLAGSGSFVNGTLSGTRVLADGTVPDLDGLTLDGTVTVVFGDGTPEIGTTVDVARYSGDISKWKGRSRREYSVSLSKAGDVVRATVEPPKGAVIMLR